MAIPSNLINYHQEELMRELERRRRRGYEALDIRPGALIYTDDPWNVPANKPNVSNTPSSKKDDKKEPYKMMTKIKETYNKHSDIINMALAAILVDHFVFGGKFRAKFEELFEKGLNKISNMVDSDKKA